MEEGGEGGSGKTMHKAHIFHITEKQNKGETLFMPLLSQ